jgi:hypothetical protein
MLGTCPNYFFVRFVHSNSDSITFFSFSRFNIPVEPFKLTGSGDITDGSQDDQYASGSNCAWLITPSGDFDWIQIVFTEFDTELFFDSVAIFDGPDETFPILLTASGSDVPAPIVSSQGVVLIMFTADQGKQAGGFRATFTAGKGAILFYFCFFPSNLRCPQKK